MIQIKTLTFNKENKMIKFNDTHKNTTTTLEEITFPALMEWRKSGSVWLLLDKDHGVCLKGNSYSKVGTVVKSMSDFKGWELYNNPITISNA